MAGGGSIQGMINSLKNNKRLLRRKRMFSKDRSFLNLKREYLKAAEGELDLKKATKEQLFTIRTKVVKAQKKRNYINIGVLIVTFCIVGVFIYSEVQATNTFEKTTNKIEFNKNEKKYLAFIADGDNWLSNRKWHNAIFQYKEAQELFPEEFAVNYRLVSAYCYRCNSEFVDCKKAKELLDKLIIKYPDKSALLKLKETLDFEYIDN